MPSQVSMGQEFRKRVVSAALSPWASDPQADFTLVDAVSGSVTVNLPAHSAMFEGARSYLCYFKRTDASANAVTLLPASGLVDGAASKTMQTLESVGIISDGTNYQIVRTNIGPLNLALSGGSATSVAVLLAGGSVDLTVPISPTLVDNNYQAVVVLTNAPTVSLLGSVSVQIKTKSTSSVVVTLKNTGLLTLAVGQTVDVICLHS